MIVFRGEDVICGWVVIGIMFVAADLGIKAWHWLDGWVLWLNQLMK